MFVVICYGCHRKRTHHSRKKDELKIYCFPNSVKKSEIFVYIRDEMGIKMDSFPPLSKVT